MSRRTFEPEVYAALAGASRKKRSNREVARLLRVDEATVRRALKTHAENEREKKRAYDRAALLTEKGRARTRRFRLNEFQTRMKQRRTDTPLHRED